MFQVRSKVCIYIIVFIYFLFSQASVYAAPFYFESKNYGVTTLSQKNQIEKLFNSIDTKLGNQTEEKKRVSLSGLEKQILAVGKNLKEKNTAKYQKHASLLNLILSEIYTRNGETKEISKRGALSQEKEWDIFTFSPKAFVSASGSLDTTLGEFTLSQDTTIDALEITLVSDSKINLAGQKKYVRIQRADGSLNVALSGVFEVESDTQLRVKFSSAMFLKAGSYRFNGIFENTGNSFYDTYINTVRVGQREFTPEKGSYKLGETSIESPKIYSFGEIGMIQKPYEVQEIDTFLGAFEVYGDEFFFENLRLKITADTKLQFGNEQMYLLDATGDIFATSSGYQEKDGIVYVSFRNVVMKPGIYQLGLTRVFDDSKITQIQSFIDEYQLKTLKESFAKNYFFGFPLTQIQVK